jgi:hypothetical protein
MTTALPVIHLRLRVKKLGGHYHCRLFSGASATATHARNGELVFDEKEWPAAREQFKQIAEVIEEEALVP